MQTLKHTGISNLFRCEASGNYYAIVKSNGKQKRKNLKIIRKHKLAGRAAKLGRILCPELQRIQQKRPLVLGCFQGKGLVAGIQVVKPGTREPDAATATRINAVCLQKGLLMFAPVGVAGECLKVAPPLTIPEAALRESIAVFEEAVDEVLGA